MKLLYENSKLSRLPELLDTFLFDILTVELTKVLGHSCLLYLSSLFWFFFFFKPALEREGSFFSLLKPANLMWTWYSALSWGFLQWRSWLSLTQDHNSAKKCASSVTCFCCFALSRICTDLIRLCRTVRSKMVTGYNLQGHPHARG